MLRTDRIASLKNAEIFREIPDEKLAKFSSRFQERTYPPNTAIIREGTYGDTMFIIISGRVDILKRDPNGDFDVSIAALNSGACFGEMALISGNPRSATVVTAAHTKVLVLKKKDFDLLLNEYHSMSISLSRIVAERIEGIESRQFPGTVPMDTLRIDETIVGCVPEQLIRSRRILPISYVNNKITLAMVDPNDVTALDEIKRAVNEKYPKVFFDRVIITGEDFESFMESDYQCLFRKHEEELVDIESYVDSMDNIHSEILKEIELDETGEDDQGITDLAREAEGAPIIKLTNNIIA
ncbi:MAG TPA: cyclic nucleotide-binding domain-containing protein, partial [Syntrophorhabdaceae bacterium]|nr:cyclic nucleotide-binding domain-containing protein [Syntrophorhabdaceae bacterium]